MQRNKYFKNLTIQKKYTVFFFIVLGGIFCQSFFRLPATAYIEDYYNKKIKEVKKEVALFQQGSKKKLSLSVLKKYFLTSRVSYKKLAVLSEYFNPYETILLNSPALERLASDSPDDIISPDGFQAVEQLLYDEWNATSYTKLDKYLTDIQKVLTRLENEADKKNMLKPELVWDALRAATLRIITLGVTGFDSPVAQLSLPEALASLDGIKEVLLQLKNNGTLYKGYSQLTMQVSAATDYIKSHPDFNKFDRLVFITRYADPFYKQINKLREPNNISIPGGANPINYASASIFDENAFDINFFSPGNEYRVTSERVALGKKLFYDNILSGTRTRSCASCHNPEQAFADGLKTPVSIDNKTALLRNSPSLLNCAFQTKFFYDSRVSLLEGQFSAVIHNADEMQGSLEQSVIDIKNSPVYAELFLKAYPNDIEALTTYTITNAVSSYVRSLVSLNSRFDKYMRGDEKKLSSSEKNGFNLFAGKAKCATCHFIPLFNGLAPPVFNTTESEILGVPGSASKINPVLDKDSGKAGFTQSVIHNFSFKTPTIRNVALTAPYMHNGVFNTLEEVVDFYNDGGGKGLKIDPPNQSLPFDKLNLSAKEKKDIIAFMKALTDTSGKH